MRMNQLVPASQLSQSYGCKAVVYGSPGTGKTPIIQTAPRPVLLAVEPGLLSMKNAHNVPTWEGYTPERISEFFDWLFKSNEASNFDTVGIDSGSQVAEIFLTQELARNKDGRKAYGEMSKRVMEIFNALYYLRNKHIYLIAKEGTVDEGGTTKRRPYFPGQDLNVKVPHLFDLITHLGRVRIPEMQMQEVTAFRTRGTIDVMARDRSGNLNELEPPNLADIFAKATRG